jgi:hypothetical protein
MKHLFAAAALGLACVACQPAPTPPASTAPAAETPPGAPGAAAPSPTSGEGAQASVPPPGQAAMAEAGDLVPGIPACRPGDNRTPIPVWKPTIDAHNNVDTEPPQQPGQVVVLELQAHHAPKCNDSDANAFRHASTEDPAGGLEISVRGNTQEVGGVCHLSGLYRNATGLDAAATTPPPQGWTRIAFNAADASEIASANTYCVQQ